MTRYTARPVASLAACAAVGPFSGDRVHKARGNDPSEEDNIMRTTADYFTLTDNAERDITRIGHYTLPAFIGPNTAFALLLLLEALLGTELELDHLKRVIYAINP